MEEEHARETHGWKSQVISTQAMMLLAKTNEFVKLVTLNVEVIYRKGS